MSLAVKLFIALCFATAFIAILIELLLRARARVSELNVANLKLRTEVGVASEHLEASLRWIMDAKPLLERGGLAERATAQLRDDLASEQAAHDGTRTKLEAAHKSLNDCADVLEAHSVHGDHTPDQLAEWAAEARRVTGNLPVSHEGGVT